MTKDKDLYALLGVAATASADEIRDAYRSAAKANHPDRFLSYFQKLKATVRMQDLNNAYSVLRDPDRRRTYDKCSVPQQAQAISPRVRSDSHGRVGPAGSGAQTNWWIIAAWPAASCIFAYFVFLRDSERPSGFWLIYIAVVSLVVVPLLALLVAVPVFVFAHAFQSSFADTQATTTIGLSRLLRDFIMRTVGLALAIWLSIKAFQWGIRWDLLYLMLLIVSGSLAGELCAMFAYLVRGLRVVKVADELIRNEEGMKVRGA